MDLFVDAIDSKLQTPERFRRLVKNKKISKTSQGSKSSIKNKNSPKSNKSSESPVKLSKYTGDNVDKTPVESVKVEDEESLKQVPFLNFLIDSCTNVVREVNRLSTDDYRNCVANGPDSEKITKINKCCLKAIDKINGMVKNVASDHVFDAKTNTLDVLFDEIEFGLKKHTKTKYSKLKLKEKYEPISSDEDRKQKLDEANINIKMDKVNADPNHGAYKHKSSLKRELVKYEKATLNSYSLDMDATKYNLPARPQDNWKDMVDNFSTRSYRDNLFEKYNKIEPQIRYNKEYEQVQYFQKNFVPKIYPKYEFLRFLNKEKAPNPHIYSQELNSLLWSDEKLNSTHQGHNILGGDWNLFKVTKTNYTNKPSHKMVLTTKDFDEMIEKIKKSSILSIDVEHHDLDTFKGYVCLIQLSIPDENYVVDPFNIFAHINNLNKVTTDPRILKVMHGSGNDVVWLQRDFGVYIVNLFDTREAAKILNSSAQSLSKLLEKYFNIKLNKKHQLSDWSKRPIDQDMLNYACSDSYYLIPLYVALKNEMLSKKDGKVKVIQVMNSSRNICLKQYSDRGMEINQKCRNIARRNNLQVDSLDFVSYNFMLNLISFRNYAARKLDVSEQMVIRDYQISIIIKKMKSSNFNHFVGLLCDYLYLIKYEIANLIKIKNTLEVLSSKLNNSELILMRPRSIHFIFNCLNNNNLDQFQSDQFEKLKHTTCIDNTLKVYNKFVAGGLFNNISPIQLDLKKLPKTESQAEEPTTQKRSLVEEADMVEDWKRKKFNI